MDYKRCAEEDLREYERLKTSLAALPERIALLQDKASSLRAAAPDREPVQGGTSTYEDRLINNIVETERLKTNLDIVRRKVALVDRGLAVLTDEERLVLERFYISRHYGYMDRLCEELCCERTQVYRIKDRALKKFTQAMFGMAEL